MRSFLVGDLLCGKKIEHEYRLDHFIPIYIHFPSVIVIIPLSFSGLLLSFVLLVLSQVDLHPRLNEGRQGNPGVKIKLNRRFFAHLSSLAHSLISKELGRLSIPSIFQSIPQFNGFVRVENPCITRYQPPGYTEVYSKSPNIIGISIQNFDLSIVGTLSGRITFLLPIQLSGLVQAKASGISVAVELAIDRDIYGKPTVCVSGCSVDVANLDITIRCGGLIGNLINSVFKKRVIAMVRPQISSRVCQQINSLLTSRAPALLTTIPTSVPLSYFASDFIGALQSSASATVPTIVHPPASDDSGQACYKPCRPACTRACTARVTVRSRERTSGSAGSGRRIVPNRDNLPTLVKLQSRGRRDVESSKSRALQIIQHRREQALLKAASIIVNGSDNFDGKSRLKIDTAMSRYRIRSEKNNGNSPKIELILLERAKIGASKTQSQQCKDELCPNNGNQVTIESAEPGTDTIGIAEIAQLVDLV